MATTDEVDRLLRTYAARTVHPTWDAENAGNRAIVGERERATAALLARHGLVPLAGRRVLEVGCSHGNVLTSLLALGARPRDLFGVDLLPDRLHEARRRHPDVSWQQANGEELPFADGSFDLVCLFTVFSSILDDRMATNVAAEIRRVLAPRGGAILWYDFRHGNPRNPAVRGIGRASLRRLFPDLEADVRAVTLAPPLARRLGAATRILYPALAVVPLLRTHYLALLRTEGGYTEDDHAPAASWK